MKQEIIDKLPPDAQKEFLKLAMKLNEKTKQSKVHDSFLDFVKHVWPEFIEGKHHKKIADKFNQIASGKIKRLIIICHLGILSQSSRLIFFPLGW